MKEPGKEYIEVSLKMKFKGEKGNPLGEGDGVIYALTFVTEKPKALHENIRLYNFVESKKEEMMKEALTFDMEFKDVDPS